jgi:tetratricopeptide (TPR) repeat protein
LYNELANQQEQMKNYKKAIDLLYKLLEILEALKEISPNLKEGGLTEKENEDKKTESYLKISNLYYRMKDYDNVIETLGKIPNIKSENESNLSVKYLFNNFIILYKIK